MTLDTRAVGRFAMGQETPVPCDRIEEELDALWRQLARKSAQGKVAPMWRACLLNLVVHAGDAPSEVVARYLAGAVSDVLPARVILVRARPEEAGPAGPKAWVAAIPDPERSDEERTVSSELVVLEAAGAAVERLPALVRSVLETDMTTTLWWTGPAPAPRPYVDGLRRLADRIVIDSDTFDDDAPVGHLLPVGPDVELADLAWPRLAPWRRAIARAFDPPAHRAFLHRLREVRIGAGGPAAGAAGRATSGPLLAGWLAAALGWRACARAGDRAVCFSGAGQTVAVCVEARAGAAAGLTDVALAAAGGAVVFRRAATPDRIETVMPAGCAPCRPVPLAEPDPAEVLAAALLEVRADPIAPDAVRRAAEISATMSPREGAAGGRRP